MPLIGECDVLQLPDVRCCRQHRPLEVLASLTLFDQAWPVQEAYAAVVVIRRTPRHPVLGVARPFEKCHQTNLSFAHCTTPSKRPGPGVMQRGFRLGALGQVGLFHPLHHKYNSTRSTLKPSREPKNIRQDALQTTISAGTLPQCPPFSP